MTAPIEVEAAKRKVLEIWPDAYINEDYSGSPSADVAVFRKATKDDWPKNREIPISDFKSTETAAWLDAASRLPALSEVEVKQRAMLEERLAGRPKIEPEEWGTPIDRLPARLEPDKQRLDKGICANCGHGVSAHEWEEEGVSCCMQHIFGAFKVGEGKPCMCPGYKPFPAPASPLVPLDEHLRAGETVSATDIRRVFPASCEPPVILDEHLRVEETGREVEECCDECRDHKRCWDAARERVRLQILACTHARHPKLKERYEARKPVAPLPIATGVTSSRSEVVHRAEVDVQAQGRFGGSAHSSQYPQPSAATDSVAYAGKRSDCDSSATPPPSLQVGEDGKLPELTEYSKLPQDEIDEAIEIICFGGKEAALGFFQRHPHLGLNVAIAAQADLMQRESQLLAALKENATANEINAALRFRIHKIEEHNQYFYRCESAWCHPTQNVFGNPALNTFKGAKERADTAEATLSLRDEEIARMKDEAHNVQSTQDRSDESSAAMLQRLYALIMKCDSMLSLVAYRKPSVLRDLGVDQIESDGILSALRRESDFGHKMYPLKDELARLKGESR